jgi:hypothetical protein|tara:strand:- start:581 stop:877 length:297 start_codon:yes stop_codon:yes gene_type:complete
MSKIEEAVIAKIRVKAVIAKIRARARTGKAKYNTTMERTDLRRKDWLNHAQEETMDLAIYLQKIEWDETKPGDPRLIRAQEEAMDLAIYLQKLIEEEE